MGILLFLIMRFSLAIAFPFVEEGRLRSRKMISNHFAAANAATRLNQIYVFGGFGGRAMLLPR
jgi:hypothetical protein